MDKVIKIVTHTALFVAGGLLVIPTVDLFVKIIIICFSAIIILNLQSPSEDTSEEDILNPLVTVYLDEQVVLNGFHRHVLHIRPEDKCTIFNTPCVLEYRSVNVLTNVISLHFKTVPE